MNVLLDFVIIAVCIAGLWIGANWVVRSATLIARRVGLSELIIGLTVVAIGTSAPEFAVTVVAAVEGKADISVGNVVGSNIFNLGFILGGLALFKTLKTTKTLVNREGTMLIGTTFLLVFFLRDLTISRLEGIFLLVLLIGYVVFLISQREASEEENPEGEFRWYEIPRLLAGLAALVISGHFLVESAVDLARLFGVSEWVIGVTIVAIGTSTPEIATSGIALLRGKHAMSAGNLIGSDLFNLLGVLGLAAFISPLIVDQDALSSVFVLTGIVILVVLMMRSGRVISRLEGGILIAINVVRWVLDFV
ncbi:MAG: sodium:calcium antiporter [Chloroflexi bacterium]|nr:MAG: sodium:calcium antiporter [Chloroflexota bacterium]